MGPDRFVLVFDEPAESRLGVLVAAEVNLRTRRDAEIELLRLALAWADLHGEESLPRSADGFEERRRRLAGLVGVRMGGAGTPLVLSHCPAELGAVLETTHTGARHLIADALDLRARLPRLWETVQDGAVAAWKARRVATATRALTGEQVAEVDGAVHGMVAALGWSRFEAVLDATVKRADPEGARAMEEEAAVQRFVAVGRANDHHIRTLIARGSSQDILSFLAAVNRIADLLAVEGDTDLVDVRRSKAVGILARPAHALSLLSRHQEPLEDGEPAQGEPDPEQDGQLASPPVSPHLREGHRCSCAPRIQLHVHLTDAALSGADPRALCRVEGVGPVTAWTVRNWLGRSDVSVTVRSVVIPDPAPIDAYEIPRSIRDAVTARLPGSVFPWSDAVGPAVDLDHTVPYHRMEQGGPPGQTAADNLGPLARREHVSKTFGHFRARQPAAGVFFWRSRHGWIWLVTNTGTHPLGRNAAARALWQAAAPRSDPAVPGEPSTPAAPLRQPYPVELHRPSPRVGITLRT